MLSQMEKSQIVVNTQVHLTLLSIVVVKRHRQIFLEGLRDNGNQEVKEDDEHVVEGEQPVKPNNHQQGVVTDLLVLVDLGPDLYVGNFNISDTQSQGVHKLAHVILQSFVIFSTIMMIIWLTTCVVTYKLEPKSKNANQEEIEERERSRLLEHIGTQPNDLSYV